MGFEKTEKEVEAPPNEMESYVVHLPRPLNIEEKKYLLAVERGDLVNVKRFIQFANKGSVNVSLCSNQRFLLIDFYFVKTVQRI